MKKRYGLNDNYSFAQKPQTSPLKDFGQDLKAKRKAWQLSQRQLAEMAGTTQATIAHIEAGTANPSIDLLNRIAAAIQLDLNVTFKRRGLRRD